MKRNRELIATQVSRSLVKPQTPDEEAPALLIAETIRLMRVSNAKLLKSGTTEQPVVTELTYRGGGRPDDTWAPRLFARIIPEKGPGWIARLNGFNPSTRTLFLVPRPDRLDESIAAMAQQEIAMRISCVTLGVFFVNHHLSQEFFLLQ